MDKRGGTGGEGGSITIFRRKFFVSVPKKFRRGTLLCFRKLLVSKNFMDKRGRGSIMIFPRKNFVSVPKKFVGEPFCVSENFWYRKILWIRGGGGGGVS